MKSKNENVRKLIFDFDQLDKELDKEYPSNLCRNAESRSKVYCCGTGLQPSPHITSVKSLKTIQWRAREEADMNWTCTLKFHISEFVPSHRAELAWANQLSHGCLSLKT